MKDRPLPEIRSSAQKIASTSEDIVPSCPPFAAVGIDCSTLRFVAQPPQPPQHSSVADRVHQPAEVVAGAAAADAAAAVVEGLVTGVGAAAEHSGQLAGSFVTVSGALAFELVSAGRSVPVYLLASRAAEVVEPADRAAVAEPAAAVAAVLLDADPAQVELVVAEPSGSVPKHPSGPVAAVVRLPFLEHSFP